MLPNIVLGALIAQTLHALVGAAHWILPELTGAVFLVSLGVYSVADNIVEAIEEEKRKTLSDETDYPGIE